MSAGSAITRGRSAASQLMVDTGKALRPTGGKVYDPETQTETDEYDDLFTGVACKIKGARLSPRDAEVGERTATIIPAELHLPAKAAYAGLIPGDVWELTKVDPLSLNTVGHRYRIASEVDGTYVTACRYTVERVVS